MGYFSLLWREKATREGGRKEEMKCERAIAADRDAELSSVITKAAFISGTTRGNRLCHESVRVKIRELRLLHSIKTSWISRFINDLQLFPVFLFKMPIFAKVSMLGDLHVNVTTPTLQTLIKTEYNHLQKNCVDWFQSPYNIIVSLFTLVLFLSWTKRILDQSRPWLHTQYWSIFVISKINWYISWALIFMAIKEVNFNFSSVGVFMWTWIFQNVFRSPYGLHVLHFIMCQAWWDSYWSWFWLSLILPLPWSWFSLNPSKSWSYLDLKTLWPWSGLGSWGPD